jgi:hypothetical protein
VILVAAVEYRAFKKRGGVRTLVQMAGLVDSLGGAIWAHCGCPACSQRFTHSRTSSQYPGHSYPTFLFKALILDFLSTARSRKLYLKSRSVTPYLAHLHDELKPQYVSGCRLKAIRGPSLCLKKQACQHKLAPSIILGDYILPFHCALSSKSEIGLYSIFIQ